MINLIVTVYCKRFGLLCNTNSLQSIDFIFASIYFLFVSILTGNASTVSILNILVFDATVRSHFRRWHHILILFIHSSLCKHIHMRRDIFKYLAYKHCLYSVFIFQSTKVSYYRNNFLLARKSIPSPYIYICLYMHTNTHIYIFVDNGLLFDI